MGANCATPAETADSCGPVSEVDRPRHSRRDFVHCTRRLQLASYPGRAQGVASRPSTLANNLWLLLALARPRAVLGLVLLVVVHSASVQDGAGGLLTLQKLVERIKHDVHNRWCRLKLIWADGGYTSIVEKVRQQFGWTLEIVKRSDDMKGFQVLPRRWVVERTFGWLGPIVVCLVTLSIPSLLVNQWFTSSASVVCLIWSPLDLRNALFSQQEN